MAVIRSRGLARFLFLGHDNASVHVHVGDYHPLRLSKIQGQESASWAVLEKDFEEVHPPLHPGSHGPGRAA